MCTLVLLFRPDHHWPILIAANRDEMRDRPWLPPARHWPNRPQVVAGLDQLAGGSWLGMNDAGVIAAVMNRVGSLGPALGMRSRGELVLTALDHDSVGEAATGLVDLDTRAFRPFNLVVADHQRAVWLRHAGNGPAELRELPPGLSMFTAYDRNDSASPRVRAFLPQFESASSPDPDINDWRAWESLLGNRQFDPAVGPEQAMYIGTAGGFGTVSSALMALPRPDYPGLRPRWRFAAAPTPSAFWDIAL